jgi:hypothetical protein
VDEPEAPPSKQRRTANLSVRAELWQQLGDVVETSRVEGVQTSRREITEALWHYYLPMAPADVQVLVRAYRQALLGRDPGRPELPGSPSGPS